MHIIPRKRLNDFARDHPDTRTALEHWYRNMKRRNFASLAEVRTVFPTADKVGKLTVFNIGGNKVRLITAIHYNRHKVYIRAVLTHEEYDQDRWKEYRMLQKDMGSAVQAWHALESMVYVPHMEEEYQRLVAFLDALIDEIGEDETHPLASLMEVVGVLIERYEEEHVLELTEE